MMESEQVWTFTDVDLDIEDNNSDLETPVPAHVQTLSIPPTPDWQTYYHSLTPRTAGATPTTATTKVGTPKSGGLDKPRLSLIIPCESTIAATVIKEKTFARKRRGVPKPLSLWDISNARGKQRSHSTSLPGSPFFLAKEHPSKSRLVETPCDILSAVEFDLQAALQSVTQNIPVSVRKTRASEDQWKYYGDYDDDNDDDGDENYDEDEDVYMSDPGTSYPSPSPLPSPKIPPSIQRGRQNPFPVRPLVPKKVDDGDANALNARAELLKKRYNNA